MIIPKEFRELQRQLRNKKVFLVNVPDHNNIGDHLIWFGEEIFLKETQCTIRGITSRNLLDTDDVLGQDIILLHGGGNFGDLYPEHQILREDMVSLFPNNKIIIFPQTSYFRDHHELQRGIDIFSQHKDLTLCARDRHTYAFFHENFQKNTILLMPDMTATLERGDLHDYIKDISVEKEVLFLLRADSEIKKTNFYKTRRLRNAYDWKTLEDTSLLRCIKYGYERIRKFELKYHHIKFYRKLLHNIVMPKLLHILQKKYVEKGTKTVEKYTTIVTDRLHGALLGLILGKKVILLDNSYGKNKTYYDTWLSDNKHISFADSLAGALDTLEVNKKYEN